MMADAISDPDTEAQKVINSVYPGFREPLRIAHGWIADKGKEWLGAAVCVLEHLRDEYPTAIQVRSELVLAYLQAGPIDRAEKELKLVEALFHDCRDEETLCRFGRLHRDLGVYWLTSDTPTDDQFNIAGREYNQAWDFYDRAFRIRFGHYPGINRASLFLLRGWAERVSAARKTFFDEARTAAQELLDRQTMWPKENPEDDIWHAASAAEARLLLGHWPEAVENYRSAAAHKLTADFHRQSIGTQLRRVLRALREFADVPKETETRLLALFPAPSPPASGETATPKP